MLVAEILKQYHPKLVQLHNYPSASALNAKFNNWKTLNCTFLVSCRESAEEVEVHDTPQRHPKRYHRCAWSYRKGAVLDLRAVEATGPRKERQPQRRHGGAIRPSRVGRRTPIDRSPVGRPRGHFKIAKKRNIDPLNKDEEDVGAKPSERREDRIADP